MKEASKQTGVLRETPGGRLIQGSGDEFSKISGERSSEPSAESSSENPRDTSKTSRLYVIPSVVLNDDGVTLDDMTPEDMEKAAGARLAVVSCNPSEYLGEIIDLVQGR